MIITCGSELINALSSHMLLAGPNILDPPQSQDIIQGDSVVFNCTSSSEPLHSIMWMFNDTVIATYDAETNNGLAAMLVQ